MPAPVSVLFSILRVRSPPVVSTNRVSRMLRCGKRPLTSSDLVARIHSKSNGGGSAMSRSPRASM
jgi:hypothetical protein